jgi:hypothetical protein
MKTIKKTNKYILLFNKYSRKKKYLTPKEIKSLIKKEFKLVYSNHIFDSFIAIWSSIVNDRQVITKSTFINKLFKKPDGFFRFIQI